MILAFSDLHLGIRTYSQFLPSGLFTAERESRLALEELYTACADPKITYILYLGDWFHTNQPTTENIKHTIGWLKMLDTLNKPFYIIPGNHDAAMYSNSLAFMHSLKIKNIRLVTSVEEQTKFEDWTIRFIPYVYNNSMKTRDEVVHTQAAQVVQEAKEKTIIVGHFQETSAKIGSESLMISKGVEIIELDNVHQTKDIILLLGHMHKPQVYKKGYATICYPGSCGYHEAHDIDEQKGYITFDAKGTIEFVPLTTIRSFVSFHLPEGDDVALLNNRRIKGNQVLFITKKGKRSHIYEQKLLEVIKQKGCSLGKITYIEETSTNNDIQIVVEAQSDPFFLLEEYSKALEVEDLIKLRFLTKGREYLEKVQ